MVSFLLDGWKSSPELERNSLMAGLILLDALDGYRSSKGSRLILSSLSSVYVTRTAIPSGNGYPSMEYSVILTTEGRIVWPNNTTMYGYQELYNMWRESRSQPTKFISLLGDKAFYEANAPDGVPIGFQNGCLVAYLPEDNVAALGSDNGLYLKTAVPIAGWSQTHIRAPFVICAIHDYAFFSACFQGSLLDGLLRYSRNQSKVIDCKERTPRGLANIFPTPMQCCESVSSSRNGDHQSRLFGLDLEVYLAVFTAAFDPTDRSYCPWHTTSIYSTVYKMNCAASVPENFKWNTALEATRVRAQGAAYMWWATGILNMAIDAAWTFIKDHSQFAPLFWIGGAAYYATKEVSEFVGDVPLSVWVDSIESGSFKPFIEYTRDEIVNEAVDWWNKFQEPIIPEPDPTREDEVGNDDPPNGDPDKSYLPWLALGGVILISIAAIGSVTAYIEPLAPVSEVNMQRPAYANASSRK